MKAVVLFPVHSLETTAVVTLRLPLGEKVCGYVCRKPYEEQRASRCDVQGCKVKCGLQFAELERFENAEETKQKHVLTAIH